MRPALLALLTLTTLTPLAHPQAPLAYDAVAIKPNTSLSGSTRLSIRDATFLAQNVTIKMLLSNAYGIRDGLISGLPGWTDSAHYDINAKVVDFDPVVFKSVTSDQRRAMLATILAERFHLKVHTETKELPIYELVLAKDGPKFQPSGPPPPPDPNADPNKPPTKPGPGSIMINNNELTAYAVPISNLIGNLEYRVSRSIIDKTGLTAKYDLHLKWAPDDANADNGKAPDDSAPPLFIALQEQLGLKLVPSKGPVVTLVVDHVDPPTEN